MTKEELKLHIEKRFSDCSRRSQGLSYGSFYDGYMDCYNTLEQVILGNEEEIAELEAQIEKMKNFQNCDYQLHIVDCPIFKSGGHISCKKCPHWTLQKVKEND